MGTSMCPRNLEGMNGFTQPPESYTLIQAASGECVYWVFGVFVWKFCRNKELRQSAFHRRREGSDKSRISGEGKCQVQRKHDVLRQVRLLIYK